MDELEKYVNWIKRGYFEKPGFLAVKMALRGIFAQSRRDTEFSGQSILYKLFQLLPRRTSQKRENK